MLKYKILIKLFVLSCMLLCYIYGDTIQTEVVVLCLTHFQLLPSDVRFQCRAPTFTFFHLMFDFSTARPVDTTPPTLVERCRHIYSIPTHNSAQIILSVFYILTKSWNFYLKGTILYICKLNCCDILRDISFKEHLPEDGRNRWPTRSRLCSL